MSKQSAVDDDVEEFVDDGFFDSETNSSNTIVALDAHTLAEDFRGRTTITTEELGLIADVLGDAGFLDAAAKFEIMIQQFSEHDDFIPRMTVGELTELQLKVVAANNYSGIEMDNDVDGAWDRGLALQTWAAFVNTGSKELLDIALKQQGVSNMVRRRTREPLRDPFDLEQNGEVICLDDNGQEIETLDGICAFEPKR